MKDLLLIKTVGKEDDPRVRNTHAHQLQIFLRGSFTGGVVRGMASI